MSSRNCLRQSIKTIMGPSLNSDIAQVFLLLEKDKDEDEDDDEEWVWWVFVEQEGGRENVNPTPPLPYFPPSLLLSTQICLDVLPSSAA